MSSQKFILAKQTGCLHPVASSTLKHRRAFVFVRLKSADKDKPLVSGGHRLNIAGALNSGLKI
jgi:hypothetical protein